jgi:uncharacterized protein (DUF952 family)
MKIYHIVLPEVWETSAGPHYEAESLASEGFIHCSFEDQLDAVLKRYYSGRDEVVILEIDPVKLDSKLVVEPSTGGENYPHIYGTINRDAIVATETRKLVQ